MNKINTNRKDLKMKTNNSKFSTIVMTLAASVNAGALVYAIYLVFAVTV